MTYRLAAVGLVATTFAIGLSWKTELRAAEANPLALGCLGDFSGPYAAFGNAMQKGVALAVDQANEGRQQGRKIQLHLADDHGRFDDVAEATTRLIEHQRVTAVIGEVNSPFTAVAAKICQKHKIPIITPSASDEELTEIGDHVFRACLSERQQGRAAANFARTTMKAKSAVVLTRAVMPSTSAVSGAFVSAFRQSGGTVGAPLAYTTLQSDFKTQIGQMKRSNPDVVFVAGFLPEVGTFVKQARGFGLKVPMLGNDGWLSELQLGPEPEVLNGNLFCLEFAKDNPDARTQDFVRAFKQRNGGMEPDAVAAQGYDAAGIVIDALGRSERDAKLDLRTAIARTRKYPAVTGEITFADDRSVQKPLTVVRIVGRGTRFVQTVAASR